MTFSIEQLDDQIPQVPDPDTGLPIGPTMVNTQPAKLPEKIILQGRYCRLEPLSADLHGTDLYQVSTVPDAQQRFQYLPDTPPKTQAAMSEWIDQASESIDSKHFAVIDVQTGRTEGRQSLMRMEPAQQSIEIGNIYWGSLIAGTRVATEANFLFAQYAFDTLGYRRYEWKCNSLNFHSRQAAIRFGFTFEGHFRRSFIVRGRTRDTSWFSIIDEEWPQLKTAYEAWLAPENFDDKGQQKSRLSELTSRALNR